MLARILEPRPVKQLLLPIMLATVIAGVGTLLFARSLEGSRSLWDGLLHDRNGHYFMGLSFALDLRHGDIIQLVSDLDKAQVWPPLHALLVAIVLLVVGVDHRYAVLPSVVAWMGTALMGFFLARRMAPRRGTLAGLTAMLFIVASPAYRFYATDVMLESLGACLSLTSLYLYVQAVDTQSVSAWRRLAFGLTVLFLCKGNYWLLVVLALSVVEAANWWGPAGTAVRSALASIDWSRWGRRQLRRPLNYVLAATLVLIGVAWFTDYGKVSVAGRSISFTPPRNLVTMAYAIIFLRVAQMWWTAGDDWRRPIDPRVRAIALWHALPVAVWFLWPRRLASFLWLVSPANALPTAHIDPLSGLLFYSQALASHYHPGLASTALAVGLIIAAAVVGPTRQPANRAVLSFVVIAAALTVLHPNHQLRFMHSWIAVGWVVAGVGLAAVVDRVPRWRTLLSAAAGTALGVVLLFEHQRATTTPQMPPPAASTLDLTDAYLPALVDSRRVGILASPPMTSLILWTFFERYPQRPRTDLDVGPTQALLSNDQPRFQEWLLRTDCDTLVVVDVQPGTRFRGFDPWPTAASVLPLLASQGRFVLSVQYDLPHYGSHITIWRRAQPP